VEKSCVFEPSIFLKGEGGMGTSRRARVTTQIEDYMKIRIKSVPTTFHHSELKTHTR
jgi:hypothetical protein